MAYIRNTEIFSLYSRWVERRTDTSEYYPAQDAFSAEDIAHIGSWSEIHSPVVRVDVCRVPRTGAQVLEVRGPCEVTPPEWLVFRRSGRWIVADYADEVTTWPTIEAALGHIR